MFLTDLALLVLGPSPESRLSVSSSGMSSYKAPMPADVINITAPELGFHLEEGSTLA